MGKMMRTLTLLLLLAIPAQAQHSTEWGTPWAIQAPTQVEDFRPQILMFSPDPCPICEGIIEEARDAYCPVQIIKRTLLPEMVDGPWFYFETQESSTGWYRLHGVHAEDGETPLDYVLRRWEEEGGMDLSECWAVTVSSLQPPPPPPPPPRQDGDGYPLNSQGWNWGSLGWDPSVRSMVNHLAGSPHNFDREWLETLTERELESLHDDDHEGRTQASDHKAAAPPVRRAVRYT